VERLAAHRRWMESARTIRILEVSSIRRMFTSSVVCHDVNVEALNSILDSKKLTTGEASDKTKRFSSVILMSDALPARLSDERAMSCEKMQGTRTAE
jgi:hypothetical protein